MAFGSSIAVWGIAGKGLVLVCRCRRSLRTASHPFRRASQPLLENSVSAPPVTSPSEQIDSCPTYLSKHLGLAGFDEWMSNFLTQCGKPCQHITILPLFDASVPLHTSHHGMYGRGREDGDTDCTHYCHNALDQWSTMLFNALVPTS